MNPRIKELALQAGAGEWGDSVIPAMMDIEKFTELIVREICDIVEEDGSAVLPLVIKKHFGVRE